MSIKEKWSRSLLKTFSWRVVGTLDTFVISYILTGKFGTATAIGIVELITKTILYYGHERAWSAFSFGLKKGTEQK